MRRFFPVFFLMLLLLSPAFLLQPEGPVHFPELLSIAPDRVKDFHRQYGMLLTPAWFAEACRRTAAMTDNADRQPALAAAGRLVELARLGGDPASTARVLVCRAQVLQYAAAPDPALQLRLLDEALVLGEQAGDHSVVGDALVVKSRLLLRRGDIPAAESILYQALARCRAHALWSGAARAALALGDLELSRPDQEKAEAFYRLALRHSYEGRDPETRVPVRIALGNLAMERKQFELARDHYEKALRDGGADLPPRLAGDLSHRIARALSAASDSRGAADYWQKALIWFSKARDGEAVISTIIDLASALHDAARITEARSTYQYGLQATDGAAPATLAALNYAYARFCFRTGEYALAERHFRTARELYARTGQPADTARLDLELAGLSVVLGQTGRQETLLRRALETFRKSGAALGTATTLCRLADFELENGRPANTRKHLDEALRLYQQENNIAGEADVYRILATMLFRQHSHDRALLEVRKAERLYLQIGNLVSQGDALQLQGVILAASGNDSGARLCFRNALNLYDQTGARHNRITTLASLYHALVRLQERDEAQKILQATLQQVLELRQGSGDERRRQGFQETTGRMLKGMILTHAGIDPEFALQVLEQYRGRTFLENLQGRAALHSAGIPEERIARWLQLQQQLAGLQLALRHLPAGSGQDLADRRKTARGELQRALDAAQALEREFSDKYPRYRALRNPVIPPVQDAVSLLGEDEVVLVYGKSGETLGCWILQKDSPVRYQVIPWDGTTASNVVAYSRLLTEQQPGTVLQQQLAERLLVPVLGRLSGRIRKLQLVPDDQLGIVPWTHLIRGLGPALAPEQVTLYPGLTHYVSLCIAARTQVAIHPLPVLVFCGARYQPEPGDAPPALSPQERIRVLAQVRGGRDGEAWANLPGSLQEGQDICRIWYPDHAGRRAAALFHGLLASEEAVKALSGGLRQNAAVLRLADARILHFAVHGKADLMAAETSRLILTRKSALTAAEKTAMEKWLPDFRDEDGDLNAAEILALSVRADLVILSACQTGMGRVTETEGILGLTRSWFIAGARAVLVSLWNVSDVGTRIFMSLFHRMLAAGESPAVALEKTARMLREGSWRSGEFAADRTFTFQGHVVRYGELDLSAPYFWAAFQLWGH